MKKGHYTGLEPLALALILAPEPVTTVAGFALLGFVTLANQRNKETRHAYRSNNFNNFYSYSMKMVNNSTITYRIFTTREGQLPFSTMNMPPQQYRASI
jgi:hypothetical protein